MQVLRCLIFLTLVAFHCGTLAAPSDRTTLPSMPLSDDPDPYLEGRTSSLREKAPTTRIHLALGFTGGNYLESDEYQQGPTVVLRFASLATGLPVWDYQIEFQNQDRLLGLSMGRSWYIDDHRLNPFFRTSAGVHLDGEGQLADLVEIRRWRLRGSTGVGETFCIEMGAGIAVTGPDLFLQLGYNFSF